MRLWHYELIPYLPKKQLVSQWRECLAINSLFNNNMKSPLVDYVRNYNKERFIIYVLILVKELNKRGVNYNYKRFEELTKPFYSTTICLEEGNIFKEHNEEYLTICYYNLREKYLRGLIKEEEWQKIDNFIFS